MIIATRVVRHGQEIDLVLVLVRHLVVVIVVLVRVLDRVLELLPLVPTLSRLRVPPAPSRTLRKITLTTRRIGIAVIKARIRIMLAIIKNDRQCVKPADLVTWEELTSVTCAMFA
jgi:hypothetical protein